MSTEEIKGLPKWLDLARLEEACKPYKADPLKVLAYALSDEAREKAEVTGMTLKEQASISVKLFDKANPSQKALDVNAKVTGTVVMLQPGDADL